MLIAPGLHALAALLAGLVPPPFARVASILILEGGGGSGRGFACAHSDGLGATPEDGCEEDEEEEEEDRAVDDFAGDRDDVEAVTDASLDAVGCRLSWSVCPMGRRDVLPPASVTDVTVNNGDDEVDCVTDLPVPAPKPLPTAPPATPGGFCPNFAANNAAALDRAFCIATARIVSTLTGLATWPFLSRLESRWRFWNILATDSACTRDCVYEPVTVEEEEVEEVEAEEEEGGAEVAAMTRAVAREVRFAARAVA